MSSDDETMSANQDSSDEELESPDEMDNQSAVTNVRAPRRKTKWPTDKITVTTIDVYGMPTEKKPRLRMKRVVGLIARQQLPLTLPEFGVLSDDDKEALFNDYVQPFLEFPKDMKQLTLKKAMMMVARSFRNFKNILKKDYLEKRTRTF